MYAEWFTYGACSCSTLLSDVRQRHFTQSVLSDGCLRKIVCHNSLRIVSSHDNSQRPSDFPIIQRACNIKQCTFLSFDVSDVAFLAAEDTPHFV